MNKKRVKIVYYSGTVRVAECFQSAFTNAGYDLKTIENMGEIKEKVDVETLAKGYLWSGVKKYLLEGKD